MINKYNFSHQLAYSFPIKLLSSLSGFLIITLSLNYLGIDNYGLWITLYTFISWFSIMDFGVGGGLRNKFGEALASNNTEKAIGYISTAYFALIVGGLLIYFSFLIISSHINWYWLFSTDNSKVKDLDSLINYLFLGFILLIIGRLSNNLLFAIHRSHLASLNYLLFQFSLIIFIYFADKTSSNEVLLTYTIATTYITLGVYFSYTAWIFFKFFKSYLPSIRSVSISYLTDIFNLGLKFFIIQICAITLYSTDSFFLNFFTETELVAEYSVLQKYYGLSVILNSLILAPVWSAVVSAKTEGNYSYIKDLNKKTSKLLLLILIVIVFSVIMQPYIFELWLDKHIITTTKTSILMSLFTFTLIIMQTLSVFINGFGAIKLQLYLAVMASILNISFTIVGLKWYDFGINWAIFSSIIVNIPGMVIYRIQIIKLINNKATGIWNK